MPFTKKETIIYIRSGAKVGDIRKIKKFWSDQKVQYAEVIEDLGKKRYRVRFTILEK